jgi:PKD repeat protein
MRKGKVSWLIFVILLLVCIATQGIGIGSSNNTTTISVEPPTSSGAPGETFNVNVTVTNVTDLYEWKILIRFNSTILNATSLVRGPFLEKAGLTSWQVWEMYHPGEPYEVINNTMGYIIVGDTLMPPLPSNGATGNGTLVTITFIVKAKGATLLSFDRELTGLTTEPPTPYDIVDGVFDNREPPFLPPVASFYAEPPVAEVDETITLNASASYDPDAWLLSYEWDFGDNTTKIYKGENLTAITTHVYDQNGTYTVNLTVTDYDNLSDSTITNVTVLVHNIAITSLTAFPDTVNIGEPASINVTVANDGDVSETFNVTTYWNIGALSEMIKTRRVENLENGTSITLTLTWDTTDIFAGTGIYTISANATEVLHEIDTDDNTFSDSKVTVIKHGAPVANFTYLPSKPKPDAEVTFTSTSNDEDGYIVSWDWNFDDGNTASGEEINHTFTTVGTYRVTLTVEDNNGTRNTVWKPVEVLPPPVANFTYSPTVPLVNQTVTFNASISTPDGGTIVSYMWDFGDGITETYIGDNLTAIATHVYDQFGTYTVNLTVTDSEGLTDFHEKELTVMVHDVSVTSVIASHVAVEPGVTVTINVTAANEGNFTETFNVIAYYNLTAIDTQNVPELAAGVSKALSFNWNTTGVVKGDYIIKAVASTIPNETDIADNEFTDGVVTIAPIEIIKHPVLIEGVTFFVTTESNSTVSNFETFPEEKKIFFKVHGTSGTTGFCNVTIPFKLLGAPYIVKFDGEIKWDVQQPTNDTHVFLYLTYIHTLNTHTVEITGTTWGPPPEPPVAMFSVSPPTLYVGDKASFNASASHDPDGTIESWNWNFGDGTNDTGEIVDHTYTTAGNFTVTLTVIDDEGLTAVATAGIIVLAPPVHDVAVTNVTVWPTEVKIGEPVSINVVVTNQGDSNETFEVTVYYDNTEIKTESITNLAPGDSKTLNITWETADIDPNSYTIKAVAETLPNETKTDNNYADDTVTITGKETPAIPTHYLIVAAVIAMIIIVAAVAYFTKIRKTA